MGRINLPDGTETSFKNAFVNGVVARTKGQRENARIASQVYKEKEEQITKEEELNLLDDLAGTFLEDQFTVNDVVDSLRISLAPKIFASKEGRDEAQKEQEKKETEIREETQRLVDGLVRGGYLVKEEGECYSISETGKVFASEIKKVEEDGEDEDN